MFQIDLWRRVGTGKLAEVMGPDALARDRIARLIRFRGDWNAEWQSYSPDARQIATAFTKGINAYIGSLDGKRPLGFPESPATTRGFGSPNMLPRASPDC